MLSVDDVDGLDLMPLETPILKVSRPVAACSRCRTAKIKCDGKLPVRLLIPVTWHFASLTFKGLHIMREKRPSRGVYKYKRPIR